MARWASIFAGIALTVVGLALIAQESASTARLLDRAEIRIRRWWQRLRR